jgi:hypothetical protein
VNIYAKPGAKIVFTSTGGRTSDVPDAIKVGLIAGAIYTVQSIEVQNWASAVTLEEFPGHDFNTVMFQDEGGDKGEDEIRQKPPEPKLFYIRSYKHDQHNLKGNELAMWWCPGGNGYTYDLAKAGKYPEDKAKEICGPMNMTTVGRGARARDEANNIMYPTSMIEELAMTTVNKFDADNRLRLALAGAGS